MKRVLLSADGEISVYAVPDVVADNLGKYCMGFCDWLQTSPHAEKYRTDIGVNYTERDFIQYLNDWIFSDSPSKLVETLNKVWDIAEVPEKHKNLEWYNF